jgi:hypothetical protein
MTLFNYSQTCIKLKRSRLGQRKGGLYFSTRTGMWFVHVSSSFEKSNSRFSYKCQTIDWLGVYTVIKIVSIIVRSANDVPYMYITLDSL